jgi:putative addiction module killer protein
MEATPRTLRNYVTQSGVEPFRRWLRGLSDVQGRNVIRTKLNRIQSGSFSDCRPVGEGVHELKIHVGPGYRVYFGTDEDVVVLLTGGDKGSQVRDIARAKTYWEDYNA